MALNPSTSGGITMVRECNHVFNVRGSQYICEKCGETYKLGDFADQDVEFQECAGGRCGVI